MSNLGADSENVLAFRWRDQIIHLDDWADDEFGHFSYVSENGALQIECETRQSGSAVAIVVHALNAGPPPANLPGTMTVNGEVVLTPAATLKPATVPPAILLALLWAEWLARYDLG